MKKEKEDRKEERKRKEEKERGKEGKATFSDIFLFTKHTTQLERGKEEQDETIFPKEARNERSP